jgi:hypothetical protein
MHGGSDLTLGFQVTYLQVQDSYPEEMETTL